MMRRFWSSTREDRETVSTIAARASITVGMSRMAHSSRLSSQHVNFDPLSNEDKAARIFVMLGTNAETL